MPRIFLPTRQTERGSSAYAVLLSRSLGFYALKTEGGENVGFNVRVPIFPAKYLSVGSLRIGPARDFRQEYRYSAFSSEGVRYDTGNAVDEFMRRVMNRE